MSSQRSSREASRSSASRPSVGAPLVAGCSGVPRSVQPPRTTSTAATGSASSGLCTRTTRRGPVVGFFLIFSRGNTRHERSTRQRRGKAGKGGDSSEGAGHSAILGRVYKCRGAFIGRVSMLCIRAEHTGQGRQKKISLDPRGCEGLLLHSCASQCHIIRCVTNTRKNSRFYISFVKGTV